MVLGMGGRGVVGLVEDHLVGGGVMQGRDEMRVLGHLDPAFLQPARTSGTFRSPARSRAFTSPE
jgi:hypothetical protein